MVRTITTQSLSNFKVYNTALLTIITLLWVRSPGLTYQSTSYKTLSIFGTVAFSCPSLIIVVIRSKLNQSNRTKIALSSKCTLLRWWHSVSSQCSRENCSSLICCIFGLLGLQDSLVTVVTSLPLRWQSPWSTMSNIEKYIWTWVSALVQEHKGI